MKKKLIVLTGAGISAESGLKTFRDADGLWEGYNVMEVATPEAWKQYPEKVQEFYNLRRKQVLAAQPNAAHLELVGLENDFDVHIITQNIDDLHERAGSKNVLHLHGLITYAQSSADAQLIYPVAGDTIAMGEHCALGSQLRPHVVWFGEDVPMIRPAAALCATADYFMVIGTSLAVYPAAGLIDFVPSDVPKYIVDKHIPPVKRYANLIFIEKPATLGVKEAAQRLRNIR